MDNDIINSVRQYIKKKNIPIIGAARAEALNQKAPPEFRPEDLLPGSKSILIYAKPLPGTVYLTPNTTNNSFYTFYTRSYLTNYKIIDETSDTACYMLEEAGYPSLPIPSYSPLRFYKGEPRGYISLKHAAVEAGLGKMGKNTLLIHPERGNTLRLGGLLTTMKWTYNEPAEYPELCPDGCDLCEKACPGNALNNGNIDIMRCLRYCVKHTMLPPKWLLPNMKWIVSKSRRISRFMELFSLSFFENYGIGCIACLEKCPHFPALKKI